MEYSSLAALLQFPVAALKIDRSLVTSLIGHGGRSEAIVRGAIALAHGLGPRAIAEGTEHPIELDCLRALDCDRGQALSSDGRSTSNGPRLSSPTGRQHASPSSLTK
jgi:EAL domain-containing protein (putative c-di-GMP-specific phosphodiesterase class I)